MALSKTEEKSYYYLKLSALAQDIERIYSYLSHYEDRPGWHHDDDQMTVNLTYDQHIKFRSESLTARFKALLLDTAAEAQSQMNELISKGPPA